MTAYQMESCIRGYQAYKHLWDTSIGEDILCERESCNDADQYAVAALEDDTTVSHIPKRYLKSVCYF